MITCCVYLKALGDIQIAVTMLNEEVIDKEHPLDRHYKSLRCDMSPLDHTHDDFKVSTWLSY
jgi:poly [ADP-ribose] polymerase